MAFKRTRKAAGTRADDAQERLWGLALRAGHSTHPDGSTSLTEAASTAGWALVWNNEPLFGLMAKDFSRLSATAGTFDHDDVVQDALLFAFTHAHKWDPEHESGVRFGAYIRQRLQRELRRELPVKAASLKVTTYLVRQATAEITSRMTAEDIALLVQKREELSIATHALPLDLYVSNTGESAGLVLGDTIGHNPWSEIEQALDVERAREIMLNRAQRDLFDDQ